MTLKRALCREVISNVSSSQNVLHWRLHNGVFFYIRNWQHGYSYHAMWMYISPILGYHAMWHVRIFYPRVAVRISYPRVAMWHVSPIS